VNPIDPKDKPSPPVDARSAMISKLLHNVAHDIRTPTTAVRGYIRMLLEGRVGKVSPEQKECLEIALRSAGQLAALGTTIAEAAEVLGELNLESLDLRELWGGSCNANRPRGLAGGITINEQIPAERLIVFGDRAALSAVLERLLALAIDGAEPGSEVSAALSGGGHSDAILQIESPHSSYQLDASRNESFLKLRNQVFLHGGTLTVGKKGEQAVFTISLPGCSA
jgi:signal transduction histidine kinase